MVGSAPACVSQWMLYSSARVSGSISTVSRTSNLDVRCRRPSVEDRFPAHATLFSRSSKSRRCFSSWCHDFLLSWEDVKCKRVLLNPRLDVIVLDRVKYPNNVGAILRHMPMFGGGVVFVTDSAKEFDGMDSPTHSSVGEVIGVVGSKCEGDGTNDPEENHHDSPHDVNPANIANRRLRMQRHRDLSYNKTFQKDALRISMCYKRKFSPEQLRLHIAPKLCADAPIFELLHFLKTEYGMNRLVLENFEAFHEHTPQHDEVCSLLRGSSAREQGSCMSAQPSPRLKCDQISSLYEDKFNIVRNREKPLCLILGGEDTGVSDTIMRTSCDAGAYIPSFLCAESVPSCKPDAENDLALESSSTGKVEDLQQRIIGAAAATSENQKPNTELSPSGTQHVLHQAPAPNGDSARSDTPTHGITASCNLHVTACIALSERFRCRLGPSTAAC